MRGAHGYHSRRRRHTVSGKLHDKARALEIILGADLIDAETAERYGWINRAIPLEQLDSFISRLANNIAALPKGVIAAAKLAMPVLILVLASFGSTRPGQVCSQSQRLQRSFGVASQPGRKHVMGS